MSVSLSSFVLAYSDLCLYFRSSADGANRVQIQRRAFSGEYLGGIVSMLVGAIAWCSSLLVGRITTVLIIGKFIAFFATFSGLVGHIGGETCRQRGGGAAQLTVPALHSDDAAVLYYLVWFSR